MEIGVQTIHSQYYEEAENKESRLLDLELIEETREEVALKMAAYQTKVARFYNRKVRERIFQVGDLVLRYAQAAQIRDHEKLSETWEGPYVVTQVLGHGAYKLKKPGQEEFRHNWNFRVLKKFYV